MSKMENKKLKVGNVPNLRFKGFEEEWESKRLGDIADKVNSGKTPLGGEAVYTKEGVLFIRSQNVNNDKLELENSVFIPESINNQMKNSIVQANDILLNITGASLGRSCVVPNDFKSGNVNQHVCIIRLYKQYNPRFIQPIFSSDKGQIVFNSLQTGSGREGLNFESIKGIKLSIPQRAEQQKIASFLSLIDERITTQIKIIEELETLIRDCRNQIFKQKIRFKDEHGKPLHNWLNKRLKDVAKIFDGTHQTPIYVENGIPFYSVENVTGNNFKDTKFISEDVFQKENNRVKLEKGDILMTRIGDIGTIRLIDWDVCASFYVSLALIKIKQEYNSAYLAHYLATQTFQKELWDRTIHVAFPKKINLGEIGECLVSLPCIEEQNKIANFLSSIETKIGIEIKLLQKLERQKKFLLQNLFV